MGEDQPPTPPAANPSRRARGRDRPAAGAAPDCATRRAGADPARTPSTCRRCGGPGLPAAVPGAVGLGVRQRAHGRGRPVPDLRDHATAPWRSGCSGCASSCRCSCCRSSAVRSPTRSSDGACCSSPTCSSRCCPARWSVNARLDRAAAVGAVRVRVPGGRRVRPLLARAARVAGTVAARGAAARRRWRSRRRRTTSRRWPGRRWPAC